MIRRCLPAVALLIMHAGPALAFGTFHESPVLPAAEKYRAWREAAARVLIARGDAASLATAAALSFAGPPARATPSPAAGRMAAAELAARACEADAENPAIAWLRLQLCANAPSCDIRDAATTMRWIDAENAAAWLPSLAAARKDQDVIEVDRILQDMALGARFDLYWNRIVVLLFDTLKKVARELPAGYLTSDYARLSEAEAVAAVEIIPSFAPLVSACRESATAERREACLKLSRTMQRGDAVVAQMAGFGIEKHLTPPDSKEGRAAAEHRRVLEWRASAASRFDAPLLPWSKHARALNEVAEMRAFSREADVDAAVLKEHKIRLEPPEDRR